MSKKTSASISGGEMWTPPNKKAHISDQGNPRKNSKKKPMKSNITNKIKSKHAGAGPASDGQSEDDEGDIGALEDADDADEEPDVSALSGAPHQRSAQRLAGPEFDDDMFQENMMNDVVQSAPGAQRECVRSDDDDDYADVEDVSDSEASEPGATERSILQSAEQDLVEEFERIEQQRDANIMTMDLNELGLHEEKALARQLGLQGMDGQNTDLDLALGIDVSEDPFLGLSRSTDEYHEMWNAAESALWRMPETVRSRENGEPTTQKRVRFDEEMDFRSPSRSDSEDPNETFPDLFAVAADDPIIKQQIALGMKHDYEIQEEEINDAESFYDFDEDEKLAFEIDEESDSADDASGNESDDGGDTTDDEDPEELIARAAEMKRAARQASNSAPGTPGSRVPVASRTPNTSRPSTPRDGRGPRAGTFAVDPTRAALTTDPGTRKIRIQPPSQPPEKDRAFWARAKTANSSLDGSPNSSYPTLPSSSVDSMPARPFTAQSTLGSMFNGNLDVLRNNTMNDIREVIFPAVMTRTQTSFTSMTSTTEGSEPERRVDIDMQDLIHLDDSASESDAANMIAPLGANMFEPFPSSESNERRGSDLMDHFDQYGGVIGSFRRNQHIAKQISSLPVNPAKRASTHEYNALQKGRRGAANTPMTPARKKRASQDLTANGAGVKKHVSSPNSTRRRSRGNSLGGRSSSDIYQSLTEGPL